MTTNISSRWLKLLSLVVLLIGLASRAQAQANPAIALLDDAYATLSQANHDYNGHRVKAMKQIDAALHALGASISGQGHGREPQGTSDAQLRAALGLLQQASPGLARKPLRHVDAAIKQLNIALAIR